MTYSEAVEVKSKLGFSQFDKGGFTFDVLIVPANQSDYLSYCENIRSYFDDIEDEDAQDFSSDGQFQIVGLSFYGGNVIHSSISVD